MWRALHRGHRIGPERALLWLAAVLDVTKIEATLLFREKRYTLPPRRTRRRLGGERRLGYDELRLARRSDATICLSLRRLSALRVQQTLEVIKLVLKLRVVGQLLFDLAYCMQHGGVVASAEPAANLRQ